MTEIKDCETCEYDALPAREAPCKTCTRIVDGKFLPQPSNYTPRRRSIDDCTPQEWTDSWKVGNTDIGEEVVTGATIDRVEFHPLYDVFTKAIEQAMFGKGERHGGARTPFLEQPWMHYAQLHGRGFLTGQAAKKLEEAASTREGAAFETEMFGAIVYMGMAILAERAKK